MPAKIHVERMMYRSSIAVKGDSAASYALLKLIPAGDGGRALGLNIAMVIDVSGSMYEEDGTGISRLKRVQDAMKEGLNFLKPEDTVAIVAFAHNASVVLPSTKVSDREKIEQTIDQIDMFDVDPGGTSMNEGIQNGMDAVSSTMGAGKLTQIVVLTDGETSGETACRQLAKTAGEKKMHLTLMGVGTEWNSSLIKDLAKISEGKWYYIDVNDKASAQKVFQEEFESLASVGFMDVELHLRPVKEVIIKRVRMVVPEIKELKCTEPEERHMIAALGTLERDKPQKYVLDLKLPKRPDGKYVIAQMEVTFNPGTGKRESTGMIPLEMHYTEAQHGYINAEVARYIDEVQLFEMNQDLQKAIAQGETAKVQQVAEQIEKKGNLMGARAAKKTMLAKQVLQELNVGGRVSKKTQLAMDDMMRDVQEAPAQ
jgi:Ca-activated chloride channel family protein